MYAVLTTYISYWDEIRKGEKGNYMLCTKTDQTYQYISFYTCLLMKSLLSDVDRDQVNRVPVGQYTLDY
jgi:hypothetical protein